MNVISSSHHSSGGITGGHFEEEFVVIGKVNVTWHGLYMPYDASMRIIRRNQKPNSALNVEGIRLVDAVAKKLGVAPSEIQAYGASKTCLDVKHGVDLFLDWEGMTVTVDCTLNRNKEEYKADVIVNDFDVSDGFDLAADRIAWAFRNQQSRPSLRAM